MKIKNLHLGLSALILITSITFLASCKKDKPVKPEESKISDFTILKPDGTAFDQEDISVKITADSISVTLPAYTDFANLIADIKTDAGATVSPQSHTKQNFTRPIVYTVTSADGANKTYKVIIHPDKLKNIVYVGGYGNSVYAFNSKTGTLIWKYITHGSMSYSGPMLANGVLFAGSTDHNMYALNPVNGNLKWKFTAQSSIISTPAVANGIVYFGSDDSYVYAVDATTGNLSWKYKTGFNVGTNPVVKNGIVFIGSDDGFLYALDASSGSVKWKFATGTILVQWGVIESNGVVFVGGRTGKLFALNETDGSIKWQVSVGEGTGLEYSRAVINNGFIYVTDGPHGSLNAIKETDGSLAWKSLTGLGFNAGPAFANGYLYINANDGNFYILNAATGSVLTKKSIGANGAIPTIADGKVFEGGGAESLFYALDATSGSIIWQYSIPESINTSKPLAVDKNGNW